MTDITLTPRGPAGSNGLNFYNTTSNPMPTDGRDEETWLNTITLTLFKKTAGTWGAVASLAPSPPRPGTPGAPGKTIYSDEGPPSTQLGVSGDFYVQKSAGIGIAIYGPKAGATWPPAVALVTMIIGQAPPIPDDGIDGQVFVDATSAVFYGPKTGGAWPPGIALRSLITGSGAPAAGTGVDGQFYLDTSGCALYGPKALGAWPGSPAPLLALITGAGAPVSGTGVDGQFYLDASAGALYGPKAAGLWPAPVPLTGLITGTGAPANATGFNGQIYVDVAAHVIYGPKAGGAWPAGASLNGVVPLKPVEVWATAVNYVVGPPASYVSQGGSSYQCLVPHTSGTFASDLAAGKWGVVAQRGNDGTGTGTVNPTGAFADGDVILSNGTTGNSIRSGGNLAAALAGKGSAADTATALTSAFLFNSLNFV